jgi:U-box domain
MMSSSTKNTRHVRIPERFVCPLTLELMKYPYQDRVSGQTYERSAIVEWMCNDNATCPLTRKPLDAANLTVNNELLLEIYEWKRENNMLSTEFTVPKAAHDDEEDDTPSLFGDDITSVSKRSTGKRVTIQETPAMMCSASQDLNQLSQKILQQRQDKIRAFGARKQSKPSLVPQLPSVPSYMQMYM